MAHRTGSSPRLGDVFLVSFTGTESVQSGLRPGVIFQNNTGNLHSPNVVVLPMTSRLKRVDQPTHVLVRAVDSGLRVDSVVICENPQCISKSRLGRWLTVLPDHYMRQVAAAALLASSAISFIDPSALSELRRQADSLDRTNGEVASAC